MPEDNFVVEMLIKPFAVPVAIALVVWAIVAGSAIKRVRQRAGVPGIAGAIALAVALVIGQAMTRKMRSPWPTSWSDWTPTLLALVFVVVGWLALALWWLPRRWNTLVIGGLASLGAMAAVWPIASRYAASSGWQGVGIAGFIVGSGVVAGLMAGFMAALDPLEARSASKATIREPLLRLGTIGAMLGLVSIGVFHWGATVPNQHIMMLGLIVGVFALLALPPLRWVGAFRLRWLAPIIAITLVGLAAPAVPSSADAIPWLSVVLLGLAPLSVGLLKLPIFSAALGVKRGLLGLAACLSLAGALTLGSVAFSAGWLALPGGADVEDADDEDEMDYSYYESWSPDS